MADATVIPVGEPTDPVSGYAPEPMKTAVVTGSSGLVGSEMVSFLDGRGWRVVGVDNNMRRDFFGSDGDTTWNLERLRASTRRFEHVEWDVREREALCRLVAERRPDLIVHCAAQPSHDLAASRPFDDFEINALGTLNLLEAARAHAPESPFVFLSTNKVYGDAPNERPLVEHETRWDYADPADRDGIDETCRIDASMHSLFGASKLAADVLVQEYGRYFGLPTVCFRAGCVTGRRHAGTEQHGFLAYLARAARETGCYRIFGYGGKQVRDNIHSYDVCTAIIAFAERPSAGAVYNLGGGRANSVSILEALARLEDLLGRPVSTEYVEQARRGDHICYISNLGRFRSDYPGWEITIDLESIFAELSGREAPQLVP
jgi:CDP-paratose 2-epimerase